MSFVAKTWANSPSTSTPISAAALVDIEERLSDYTDTRVDPVESSTLDGVRDITKSPYSALPGLADVSAAIQGALDDAAAAGGGLVHVPRASSSYIVTTTLVPPSNTTLSIAEGATLDCRSLVSGSNFTLIAPAGTEGTQKLLTTNAAAGDLTLTVSGGGLLALFTDGQQVKIGSTKNWAPTSTPDSTIDQARGEQSVVSSLTDTVLTLKSPLADAYATADAGYVAPLTPVASVNIVGKGKLLADNTSNRTAIWMDRARSCTVGDGLRIEGFGECAIRFADSTECWADGVHVIGNTVGGTGSTENSFYGVNFNGCQDSGVTSSSFRDVRHAATCGGISGRAGINRRITYIASKAYNTKDTAWDSHAGCEDLTIIGVHAYDSANNGIAPRCPSAVIIGNTIVRTVANGIYLRNQTAQPSNYVVQGNMIRFTGSSGIIWQDPPEASLDSTAGQTIDNVLIKGNSLSDTTGEAIYCRSGEAWSLRNLQIEGNGIIRPATFAIRLVNVKASSVSGGHIDQVPATIQGAVRIETSDRITCTGGTQITFASLSTGRGYNILGSTRVKVVGENMVDLGNVGVIFDSSCTDGTAKDNDFSSCTTPVTLGAGVGHQAENNGEAAPASVSSATTFSVPAGRQVKMTGSNTVNHLTLGAQGRLVTIRNANLPTYAHNAATPPAGMGPLLLQGSANFVPGAANGELTLLCDREQAAWVEVGRRTP